MPREKKYVKLEAGERKAVRQSGAMRAARKSGAVTNIYSGERGGLWTDKSPKSTVPGATGRSKSTPILETKRQAGTTESKEYNREQYIKQGNINQSEFEKTRLGARMVRKATKNIAKREKRGEDVELPKLHLQNKVRVAGAPLDRGQYKQKKDERISRNSKLGEKLQKEKEKRQAMTKEQKRTAKYESKREKETNKIQRQQLRNEAAGARKNARVAKKNS
jgi:hypothetical protein